MRKGEEGKQNVKVKQQQKMTKLGQDLESEASTWELRYSKHNF
jgi:hypothetical protein